jgi:hypothetical protein
MKPPPHKPASSQSTPSHADFSRTKAGHLLSTSRTYKPKSARGRRGRPDNRNMTLNNNRRPYQSVAIGCKRGLSSNIFTDVHGHQENSPTGLVLASQRQVRAVYSSHPDLSSTHVAVPSFNNRRVYSWPHLYVSTRPGQDRHLLELPSRPLSEQRRDMQPLS